MLDARRQADDTAMLFVIAFDVASTSEIMASMTETSVGRCTKVSWYCYSNISKASLT